MYDALIIDAVRTPRGRGKSTGALAPVHPQELLAQAITQAVRRPGISAAEIDDFVVGCVSQVGDQGANIARQAVLLADWPLHVTGVTLNRYCGSGLQAVNFAAMGVMSGAQNLVVAGGVESMSRVPMDADGAEGDGRHPALRSRHTQIPQGVSADLIATLEGFSRGELDAFAVRSQQRAAIAEAEGRFNLARIPVVDVDSGEVILATDEHPRPETSLEALATLWPSFDKVGAQRFGPDGKTFDEAALDRYREAHSIDHVHTAGNSSGVVDGAAAVVIASETYVAQRQIRARARIRAMATHAEDPLIKLTAPTETSRKVLRAAGMSVRDIDLWEINEAFAAIPLQVMKRLDLDPEKVNANGGAIALGHPLGATGAILLSTALDELERRGLGVALVTLCIAGGQGIATIIERI